MKKRDFDINTIIALSAFFGVLLVFSNTCFMLVTCCIDSIVFLVLLGVFVFACYPLGFIQIMIKIKDKEIDKKNDFYEKCLAGWKIASALSIMIFIAGLIVHLLYVAKDREWGEWGYGLMTGGIFFLLPCILMAMTYRYKVEINPMCKSDMGLQDAVEMKMWNIVLAELKKIDERSHLYGNSLIEAFLFLYHKYDIPFPDVERKEPERSEEEKEEIRDKMLELREADRSYHLENLFWYHVRYNTPFQLTKPKKESNAQESERYEYACNKYRKQIKITMGVCGKCEYENYGLYRQIWLDYSPSHADIPPIVNNPQLLFCNKYEFEEGKHTLRYYDEKGKHIPFPREELKSSLYCYEYGQWSRLLDYFEDTKMPVSFILLNELVIRLTCRELSRYNVDFIVTRGKAPLDRRVEETQYFCTIFDYQSSHEKDVEELKKKTWSSLNDAEIRRILMEIDYRYGFKEDDRESMPETVCKPSSKATLFEDYLNRCQKNRSLIIRLLEEVKKNYLPIQTIRGFERHDRLVRAFNSIMALYDHFKVDELGVCVLDYIIREYGRVTKKHFIKESDWLKILRDKWINSEDKPKDFKPELFLIALINNLAVQLTEKEMSVFDYSYQNMVEDEKKMFISMCHRWYNIEERLFVRNLLDLKL